MKHKKLVSIGLTAAFLTSISCSMPAFAQEYTIAPIINENPQIRTPRYAYVESAFFLVEPSSSGIGYNIQIEGISDVTSISGTLTLYKQDSSGSYKKLTSKSLRSSSSRLVSESSFSSYGSGNYRLTFSGTVYVNGDSEPIYLSDEDSY